MKTTQNRTWSFPPTVEANLEIKKSCKRAAYNLAYFLLTFAYKPPYCPAYLQGTGKAGRRMITAFRPALWVGNFVRHSASCWFFQNRTEGNHNG